MSMMATSAPRATAAVTASCATAEESLPEAPFTMSAPVRVAHVSSCSTAAARKVSPAPSNTFLPWLWNRVANFAIEVVLPDPFTPATMMIVGASSLSVSVLSP